MKSIIIFISLFHLYVFVNAQSNQPFPFLTEVTNSKDTFVHLYVNKSKSKIFNKKLQDLNKNHPLYSAEGCESEMVLMGVTSIDKSNKKYAVVFGFCPEPAFYFYETGNYSKKCGSVGGLNLYIPGNGNLYLSGHINSNFNLRRKYNFKENNITEVKQPHYYVGLKTKTIKPLILFKSKDLKTEVAKLPKNYNIEVILAETSHNYDEFYLVKTDFGLVGWTKIKADQYHSREVEGIFWNGD